MTPDGRYVLGDRTPKPLPLKSLPAPIARLVPTLLEYARLGPAPGPAARRRYAAHLRALKAFLAAMDKCDGELRPAIAPLIDRCSDLAASGGAAAGNLAVLLEELQALQSEHRKALRAVVASHSDLFRDLYRDRVPPIQTLGVYARETWPASAKLYTRFVDRCWYEHLRHRESDGPASLAGIDVVFIAPGRWPIGSNHVAAADRSGLPVVVLAGLEDGDAATSMPALKLDHGYRKEGRRVLRRPFSAVRLYQLVDKLHLRRLAGRAAEVPALTATG